jgi:thioredoxin-related protein
MPGRLLTTIFTVAFALALLAGPTVAGATGDLLPEPELGDDGLHRQPWFQDTFLNLAEDLEEASGLGKQLVIMWEQKGCPYCRATHQINFRIPRLVDYVSKNFYVLQFNLWGDRKVTDFDGEVISEKNLARKYRILYTPTLQFFPDSLEDVGGKPGDDIEVLRVPGYFKPFHFYFLFRYVHEKGYESEPSFQRWLDGYGDKLRAMGVDVEAALWKDTLDLPEDF